ncbi:anti-sigma-F factor Fin family protein [Pseudalkalibacillus salsuginis]|uniref:anti-sigma-F factor Fin family protein n=1 Tax=Pseudalkalibacillus salsuginis TaxID=2910972 RepID=UPI001F275AA4|nr:anti-sigma-F factor Fin family protein [Pseudalkalibacillus salsuginis]MCF6411919.1 anti-sigma-F factor Fin family protein [Pseudalkalibacillus salsuginis]
MAIYYSCKHCGVHIGKLDVASVDSTSLGFDQLSDQERVEYISYGDQGDVRVKSICEDCYEMLRRNPDLHALDTFIQ